MRLALAAAAALPLALTACVPTMELRDGADRERLVEIVERFCTAERSSDPDDSRALFAEPVRRMLGDLPAADVEGRARYLTSVHPATRCEPGRTWYLGGSRLFAEVRLNGASDRLDIWRGNGLLISNILYGRKRAVGAKDARDLKAALMYEFANPRPRPRPRG